MEEQPLRPPVAGKQRPALNDGGLSHSDSNAESQSHILVANIPGGPTEFYTGNKSVMYSI